MPDNNEQPVDKQTTNEGQGEQPTQEQQGEQPADQNNKTIAYGKTSSGTIKVTIEEEKPRNMTLTLQNIQSIADYGRRSHDKWVINERSGSSLMFRNNGQSSLAASKYAQYKLNPEGASQEQTLISQTITNRKILQTDELIFNNHKFNTHIIDLSDFRKMKVDTNQNCVVGNFTVYGSVLVKAWEENLKRYVLIRRPVRMPLFSPLLNVPDIMPAVGITSPLKRTADLVGISDKGYQVNMIIFDHKTLIGKEGVDRSGINRSPEASGGIINRGSGSSGGGGGGRRGGGSTSLKDGAAAKVSSDFTDLHTTTPNPARIWDFLRAVGYNEEATAGIMGRMKQERGDFSATMEPFQMLDGIGEVGGMGMFQWTYDEGKGDVYKEGSRLALYKEWCASNNLEEQDALNQLVYMVDVDLHCQSTTLYTGHTFDPAEMNALDRYEAADLWTRQYERGKPGNEKDYADEIYEAFHGRAVTTISKK